MAQRKEERNQRIVDPYEEAYEGFRGVVEEKLDRFGNYADIAFIIGQAQGEAFARTLKSLSLKSLSKSEKAEYLSWLFSTILGDILKGEKGIVARMIVKETRTK